MAYLDYILIYAARVQDDTASDFLLIELGIPG
jgi:hypothetical protein